MKRFEIVDFLKGYSIFTIMVFHYLAFMKLPNPFDKLIFFGGTGIHLFILLSGFGLYYSYFYKPVNYLTFLKKRFTKIYVPYIFIVLLSALISLFIPVYTNSLYALGGHVFLYKMFDESIMGSYGYPLWFISMILQFYLTFHIIMWIKSRLSNKWLIISGILVSLGWAVFVFLIHKEHERVWNSFFLQYYWEFILGIVIADRIIQKQNVTERSINPWLMLTVAISCCIVYAFMAFAGGQFGRLINDYFALTGYSLLAVFLFNLQIKPVNAFFLYVGKISLSVYLLHFLVYLTLAALLPNLHALYIGILSLGIILPLSALYQQLVNGFFKISKL